jgi:hypothetical protein
MPSPTTATLTGPSGGDYLVVSTNFTVTLDQPADPGGVIVTVTDSIAGDTITSTPFTIPAGSTTGTFTITPSTYRDRNISILTVPALAHPGSPRGYAVLPTTIALTGPASINCGVASSNYTATLQDGPAGVGGIEVTVTDSVGGDTITTSPFTIPAGSTTGTFTVNPTTCGNRTISITTNKGLLTGSPVVSSVPCNCPDDAAPVPVNRSQAWTSGTVVCPPTFSVAVSVTPSALYAKDLYCTTAALSMTITE